jgi:hypothetical protein
MFDRLQIVMALVTGSVVIITVILAPFFGNVTRPGPS